MFEGRKESRGRVQPIKFKSIADDAACSNGVRRASAARATIEGADEHSLRLRRALRPAGDQAAAAAAPECSYAAVTLENVCFSVDRSQQQANFAKELLFKLGSCLAPLLSERAPSRVDILKSVNLSVPSGSIFGLLGPSSCGKTTLLRCLVGLLEPSSGAVRLFEENAPPGARQHAAGPAACWSCARSKGAGSRLVPGANVGYMPQDLGLYEDFTIEQLLSMFGRYMRMEASLIRTRVAFMADFLELPHVGRQISTLSGGQKRRVSFAIACLHMPPLIILDEPTVGVDPLLRQSIWRYLRRLASEENRTIIITTHYIEEAAQADQVALMRAGEILVQDTPARIMALHKSRSLEEAFLKICNNVQRQDNDEHSGGGGGGGQRAPAAAVGQPLKLFARPQFDWGPSGLELSVDALPRGEEHQGGEQAAAGAAKRHQATVISELQLRAQAKLALYDKLQCCQQAGALAAASDNLSLRPDVGAAQQAAAPFRLEARESAESARASSKARKLPLLKRSKLTLASVGEPPASIAPSGAISCKNLAREPAMARLAKTLALFWALLYKNYRRNVNSLPLLAFQFLLPMIQMISFSLCVGGRPSGVGLGIVNLDQPALNFNAEPAAAAAALDWAALNGSFAAAAGEQLEPDGELDERLSLRYLSFLDSAMLDARPYASLPEALADVRRAKLWAVLEIGENFSSALAQRFDLDNFYQLERATIAQSVIRIYPDRSNKILDMICHRSLVDSYRKFLSTEFDHFRRLPLEVAQPVFDIKPNVISNSIDGYTESIAPGLLASLTYIMAAGLTTFIMVVERSAGILERTYTCGINPAAYLLAHALFRSLVMMLQIGAVLLLTFYVLQQPLVGSLWLAYAQLMLLNMTGIAYGLLISSIVADQNGAALTIVSSLVVKITLSGILWPFEAIPRWLRAVCYVQPLTMPVQALKAITLKGATLADRPVALGFLVALLWLLVFLTIATRRFKFYQH